MREIGFLDLFCLQRSKWEVGGKEGRGGFGEEFREGLKFGYVIVYMCICIYVYISKCLNNWIDPDFENEIFE